MKDGFTMRITTEDKEALQMLSKESNRTMGNYMACLIRLAVSSQLILTNYPSDELKQYETKRRFQKIEFDDWGENGESDIVYEMGWLHHNDTKKWEYVLVSESNVIMSLIEHAPQMFNELKSIYEATENPPPDGWLNIKRKTISELLDRIEDGKSGAIEIKEYPTNTTVGEVKS